MFPCWDRDGEKIPRRLIRGWGREPYTRSRKDPAPNILHNFFIIDMYYIISNSFISIFICVSN